MQFFSPLYKKNYNKKKKKKKKYKPFANDCYQINWREKVKVECSITTWRHRAHQKIEFLQTIIND